MVDLKQEKERLGEKLKELEDKSHQLNMCQHHLQVSTAATPSLNDKR